MSNIGRVIRQMREERGWSQGQLGTYTGVTGGYISMVESGKRTSVSAEILARIALRFGVTVDSILERAGVVPPPKDVQRAEMDALYALARTNEDVRRILELLPELSEDTWGFVRRYLEFVGREPDES